MNKSINGIGKKFPRTQIGKALYHSSFNKLAAMSPPRNSKIGTSDIINTTNSFGTQDNDVTID